MLLVEEISQWLERSALGKKEMLAEALIDQITGIQYNGDNVDYDINKTIQYMWTNHCLHLSIFRLNSYNSTNDTGKYGTPTLDYAMNN